ASNAGGVAVSGLEMSQNSQRTQWPREEVDRKLRQIMQNIFDNISSTAADLGKSGDYQLGANAAGFKKVADAMFEQGMVICFNSNINFIHYKLVSHFICASIISCIEKKIIKIHNYENNILLMSKIFDNNFIKIINPSKIYLQQLDNTFYLFFSENNNFQQTIKKKFVYLKIMLQFVTKMTAFPNLLHG
ncbi:NADP-specific glutamate dehydrogenase-like protein, partial [Reticulomyxa filosa]